MTSRASSLRVTLFAAAGMAAVLGACGGGPSKPNVTIGVTDSAMTLVPAVTGDGPVKFDVDTLGALDHDVVIVRANNVTTLPLTAAGDVDFTKLSVADRIKAFGPGRFRIVTPNLQGGEYLVLVGVVSKGPDGQPVTRYNAAMSARLHVTKSLTGP